MHGQTQIKFTVHYIVLIHGLFNLLAPEFDI
jgi:hypothetical protein